MGKKYNSDGSVSSVFASRNLTNGEIKKLQSTVTAGIEEAIEAGNLDLLAEVARVSTDRLENTGKPYNNPNILQKISAALEIINDPGKLEQWKADDAASTWQPEAALA